MQIGDRVETTKHCFLKPRLRGAIESAGDAPGVWRIEFDCGARWEVNERCSHPRHKKNCPEPGLQVVENGEKKGRREK
jgi:hypothetical protein